ncbi:hypothetical protein FDENT_8384 [Fusarium denticulatum]|uniref:2EXR domain-containing protein n=1 Tax=Fusarium denticulatum TaxID=48507 RepID=A0A8H5U3E6_9HYPO|nr:hypothetical protein FDENT_8384 [Fusarium denticulatum]
MASSCNQNSNDTPHYLQIFNPPLEPCGNFHLFARFPADIRWLVWQHYLSHERWIDITLRSRSFTSERREQTSHQNYEIILDHRWKISKLFRTTSESRKAALVFYRVQLPCWYERKDESMVNSTLYVCPELDTLMLNHLKVFGDFAHDLWTHDSRRVGLVNLALKVGHPRHNMRTPIIQNHDVSVLRQCLSRIERLIMMSQRGTKKVWRDLPSGSNNTWRSNQAIPIRSGIQSFNRLPYDPRLRDEHLKRVFRGDWNPRHSFNHWFEILLNLQVQHKHKVIYQFGSRRGAWISHRNRHFPTISDRETAAEWVRRDFDELRKWSKRFHQSPEELGGQIDDELTRLFEPSPRPVVGFWLFPMESVFTPADLNLDDTGIVLPHPKTVDMSQHMPKLCLANIY